MTNASRTQWVSTTISLSDRDVEVWYPAEPADVEGLERETYSSLEILPRQSKTC
ncbi:MAG: hypothetical protein ACI9C1_002882 [Candidatus Aldehydirespiratoraceae bacterium]|jgi:hypothetical protein